MSDTQNAPREDPQSADQERAQLVEAIKADQPQGWTESEAGERLANLLDDDGKLPSVAAAPSGDADASDPNAEATAPNEPRQAPRPVGAGEPWGEANEQAGTVDFLVGDEPTPVSISELKAAIITAPDPQAAALVVAHRMELAKQSRAISKAIPEWRDPARRAEIVHDLREYAKEQGYSDAEINGAYDARDIVRAYRDMNALRARLVEQPETARRVTAPPLAVTPSPKPSPKSPSPTKADAAADRLRRTGRLRDAAAVMERYVK